MNLEQAGTHNRLRPEFLQAIEEKVKGFGKFVRYNFDLVKDNPDPAKYNGAKIYPNVYTLDPCVIEFVDKDEKRTGESRGKKVALVFDTDEKGNPSRFKKVQVFARDKGILKLNLEKEEDFSTAMYLEIHPKHKGGQFADKDKFQVFARIDEVSNAKNQRAERTARVKALNAAQGMSEEELRAFADAMTWDSTLEEEVLRNMAEQEADENPISFNTLVEGKEVEYRSTVKKAIDRSLIAFDPAEYKFIWVGNQQTITILSPDGDKTEIEKLSEWLQVGGKSAEDIYKRIQSLLKGKKD